jgi:hypothetical protein
MSELSLHVIDRLAGVAFVPGPVQLLCDAAELDNEVLAQVFRFDLASLLPPEPKEPCLIIAHDDASVGAAYERATICVHWVISKCILVEWVPARMLLGIAPPFTEKVFSCLWKLPCCLLVDIFNISRGQGDVNIKNINSSN